MPAKMMQVTQCGTAGYEKSKLNLPFGVGMLMSLVIMHTLKEITSHRGTIFARLQD